MYCQCNNNISVVRSVLFQGGHNSTRISCSKQLTIVEGSQQLVEDRQTRMGIRVAVRDIRVVVWDIRAAGVGIQVAVRGIRVAVGGIPVVGVEGTVSWGSQQ